MVLEGNHVESEDSIDLSEEQDLDAYYCKVQVSCETRSNSKPNSRT